jgi:SAM-dependent methyltransferase
VNDNHALCATEEWADHIHRDVLEPLLTSLDLGSSLLEIGPGPGAATDWLRHRVDQLVALEVDPEAAEGLRARFAGTNVVVQVGDATSLEFPDSTFDSVGTFTMLHHLATVSAQNRVLSEAFRALRPGGVLVGSDSLASTGLHDFHASDVYNPVEPAGLVTRLLTIGFGSLTVSVGEDLCFIAHKPTEEVR